MRRWHSLLPLFQRVICQSDDRGHGFSRNENVLGGDCQPQPLFRIQQPEDLRLERKRQIAVSGLNRHVK